ncbi:hypothetical protein C4D60_Mb05t16070 [Musa balbisiana]|uniref:Uncharacterized protein n=1 Tax=Musa balbisiana TaxID=52838 RepID=A0A4S8JWJ0_MUSBA|nr:hypothetical protein C4D60_Mb05t16070 [Musa balbisiana]
MTLPTLSGRSIRKRWEQQCRVQSRVRMQMSALSFHFMESANFFEINGGVRGLSIDDFQIGEMVRKLPNYQYMFHLPCIDSCWLVRHGSYPIR